MDENYVSRAEGVIKELKRDRNGRIVLTTSKIRNILSMVSDLYNDAQRYRNETLKDDIYDLYRRTQYLKMRMAYEAGRDGNDDVKDFIEKAKLIDEINKVGRSKAKLLDFCHYMEALVAYHKYYSKKEGI